MKTIHQFGDSYGSIIFDDDHIKTKNFVVEFNAKYDTDISSRFSYVLHELTTPFDRESAKEFVEITRQLDRIRDENTFTTIPEMNKVKSAMLGNTF